MSPYPYYNADEALQIALNMEMAGRDFYIEALKWIDKPEIVNVLKRLVADEISHMHRIAAVLAPFVEGGKESETEEEKRRITESFLETYERNRVYNRHALADMLNSPPTERAILEYALELEKKSVAYYEDKAAATDDPKGRVVFEELINEEKRHVGDLEQRLANIE